MNEEELLEMKRQQMAHAREVKLAEYRRRRSRIKVVGRINLKTAVYDTLQKEAERLGIPLNELIAVAAVEYIRAHRLTKRKIEWDKP